MNEQWTTQIIERWQAENVSLNAGASTSDMAQLEQALDFKFPTEFKELYAVADGFAEWDMDPECFSMWPTDRILEEYAAAKDDSDLIGICDFLIWSHALGFLRSAPGIFTDYDRTKPVAKTVAELVQLMETDPGELY